MRTLRPRVIPTLLLRNLGLVKGVKFRDHRYVGDPINAVQIFNAKEVDEILFLDILATAEQRIPDPELIQRIADQCLVPFTVGGGIQTLQHIRTLLNAGAEKICLNSSALERPEFVKQAAETFGSQCVMVCIDVKKNFFGKYEVYSRCGTKKIKGSPSEIAQKMQDYGAGEIVIQSIDRDGTREGYDLNLIRSVTQTANVPIIASGGAGNLEDFKKAVEKSQADSVAAGSFFVFHGRRLAVLIQYPTFEEIEQLFSPSIPNKP